MRVFSFGGGIQSTAALVLAAQGELACDAFLFANVGEDSENPATLRYVRDVAMPYAKAHGIALHELRRVRRDGQPQTIYSSITRPNVRSVSIPVRMANGAPGNRSCTQDFKIRVINRWLREHGATARKPGTVLLGISQDEWHRVRVGGTVNYIRNAYPFVSSEVARRAGVMEPLRPQGYTRMDCINVIEHAGLPVPPKSSCWFCPFHRLSTWREMRDKEPVLFAKAVDLEQRLNETRRRIGKDAVWLTQTRKPLAMAVGEASQPSLFGGGFEDDACESGYCVA